MFIQMFKKFPDGHVIGFHVYSLCLSQGLHQWAKWLVFSALSHAWIIHTNTAYPYGLIHFNTDDNKKNSGMLPEKPLVAYTILNVRNINEAKIFSEKK